MKDKIIGRKEELELLQNTKSSPSSEFIAVYGRRRVGKTFLIRHAFDNKFDFYVTGIANVSLSQQLINFNLELRKSDTSGMERTPAVNWFEAFLQLINILEANNNHNKKVILLDELPWMDTARSGFLSALEHFWNSWASARNDVILIACGSAASWMITKVINNTGGLYNRLTNRIKLEPFTLSECEAYFLSKFATFERYQIIQLYMAIGGIPYYLDKIDVGKSAAQNINKLCFETNGLLHNEFDLLYRSLFTNWEKHIAIIKALGSKEKGMTRDEILLFSKMPDGGGTTRILKELEESGFIRKYLSFGKKEKQSLYQLTDFYSLFYLHWIKDNSPLDENSWINELDSPRQRAWSGYAYEQVCLMHTRQIKAGLGISGVQTRTSSWFSTDKKNRAQIDLVIDRRDQVINICEMKFSINKFTIDKKYAEVLRNKIAVFKEQTGTRKAIFLTMITTFGLNINQYSNSLVQNDLTMDILFLN